jgi:hypothetical protein
MDGTFISGIALTFFGLLLIMLGYLVSDFMHVLMPVAFVFIGGGIALKIISVKNLG